MPANAPPVSASRFSISVDGYEIGRFLELVAASSPDGGARRVHPHELSHVMQQRGIARRVKWPPITLKRGVMQQSMLWRLRASGALSGATLFAFDQRGVRSPSYPMSRMQVVRYSAPLAKGGGEVSIEELVIATEG